MSTEPDFHTWDVDEQRARIEFLTAQRRDVKAQRQEAIRDAIFAIRSDSWDFIDQYSPLPVPGSQDPGHSWPEGALSLGLLAQRIAILRVEATRNAIQKIKVSAALEVLLTLLEEDITVADDIDIPEDR